MPTDDFHPRRYHPTKDTSDYVYAVVPEADLPAGVRCAVHVESREYLAATKGTCDRHMLSETLRTLPEWLTEVSPGRFHSAESEMFTTMMLGGLQMSQSPELLKAVAPAAAAARREAWVDPTDEHLHVFDGLGDGPDDETDEDDEECSSDPRDYLFAVAHQREPDWPHTTSHTSVYLVERGYFERHGFASDQHVEPDGMPGHLVESTESVFVTAKPVSEVRRELEAMGMTYSAVFASSLEEAYGHGVDFKAGGADTARSGGGGNVGGGRTPVRRPSDYVYSIDQADVPGMGKVVTVALVEKAFFVENGHMDDCHVSEQVKGLPKCIEEEAEGYFVSTKRIDEVCMELEAAGIRFDKDFDAFIKGPRPTPGM